MAATIFLNIDLDIQAKSGLQELLQAFGTAVVVLNNENEHHASVELSEQPQSMALFWSFTMLSKPCRQVRARSGIIVRCAL